jgi:hypothetical protein
MQAYVFADFNLHQGTLERRAENVFLGFINVGATRRYCEAT